MSGSEIESTRLVCHSVGADSVVVTAAKKLKTGM